MRNRSGSLEFGCRTEGSYNEGGAVIGHWIVQTVILGVWNEFLAVKHRFRLVLNGKLAKS